MSGWGLAVYANRPKGDRSATDEVCELYQREDALPLRPEAAMQTRQPSPRLGRIRRLVGLAST
jgi:hypothetical protein